MPQIVQAGSGYSSAMVVLLSAIPYAAATIGILLVLRGLALGIPYLSPADGSHCPACH